MTARATRQCELERFANHTAEPVPELRAAPSMIAAELPANEPHRLAELQAFDVLDTEPEQAYDDITFLASQICGAPIALISLVDRERQWFKSKVGLDATETPRDIAFCSHAIHDPGELFIVGDASADRRFAGNPLVLDDPSIRFYAGAPLATAGGNALGTLCVIDRVPRSLTPDQAAALEALSRQVMTQLELRNTVSELELAVRERGRYQAQLENYQRRLEEHLAEAAEASVTDPLTRLKNRRAFLEHLDEEIVRSRRCGTDVSLIMLDVDNFKHFNDTFGHPAGDEALEQTARLLTSQSRSTDMIARYGGEEFAIVQSGTGSDGALVLAERFRRAVESADWPRRNLTVSVGVATSRSGESAAAELLAAADAALYRAKAAGRNRVAHASDIDAG